MHVYWINSSSKWFTTWTCINVEKVNCARTHTHTHTYMSAWGARTVKGLLLLNYCKRGGGHAINFQNRSRTRAQKKKKSTTTKKTNRQNGAARLQPCSNPEHRRTETPPTLLRLPCSARARLEATTTTGAKKRCSVPVCSLISTERKSPGVPSLIRTRKKAPGVKLALRSFPSLP